MAFVGSPQLKAGTDTKLTVVDQRAYRKFADLLINQRKPRVAYETYAAAHFVQHMGPMSPNLENTLKAWEGPFSGPKAHFDIQSIRFEGDIAILTFHGFFDPARPGGTTIQRDRMVNGKIVEEWGEYKADPPSPPQGGTPAAHPSTEQLPPRNPPG